MAVDQPTASDPLNAPDHSLAHRIIAVDAAASVQSLTVQSDDGVHVKEYLRLLSGAGAPSHVEGTLYWDSTDKTVAMQSDVSGVTLQIGQEMYTRVYNDSGGQIDNGTVVYLTGVDSGTPTIGKADASDKVKALAVHGVVTEDIANSSFGYVTTVGKVRGLNTSGLSFTGPIYLEDTVSGAMTSTRPGAGDVVVVVGGLMVQDGSAGIVLINIGYQLMRTVSTRDYSFTSNGIGTGVYYRGGYYDAAAADANLDEGTTTQVHGSANVAYAAHAFAVFGGAGSVDTGQVGLRVTGTSINDDGVRTATDSQDITDDITSVSTDQYLETQKKWIGQVTFELYVVSGTPTTYSLDFNYGLCKYEDASNRDFYIVGCEVVGLAAASDTGFNVELLHHTNTGWTYAATGFVPGNGSIVAWSTDMSPEDNLVNGSDFAWKRANLTQFIDGNANEGIVFKITCGANNSVQSMDMHLVIELDPAS